MQQGPWFALHNLYGRYYAAARGGGGVGRGRLETDTDANADVDANEEGEARDGVEVGEDEELIGKSGDHRLYLAGGNDNGGAKGQGGGHRQGTFRGPWGHPGRERGWPITVSGW